MAPLTESEKLAAITWASKNSSLSYGKFMATLNDVTRKKCYADYEQELLRRKNEMDQRRRTQHEECSGQKAKKKLK